MRRLLIRPGAIGDCLLCFPALQALITDYTEIWVPRPIVPLVHFADCVQAIAATGLEMFGLGEDAAVRRKLASFDEIVSWYGANRPNFRQDLQSLGPQCRFLSALPPVDRSLHAADYFCSQVGAPLGLAPQLGTRSESVPRNTVVIHPFSGSLQKNWPLEHFRLVASRLSIPTEWLAGPDDILPEAHRIENLADLAQWISGARLYIGNDSGITHLAAATGVPTVALFGLTNPQVWAPRGAHVTVVQQDSLATLEPATVLATSESLLTRN